MNDAAVAVGRKTSMWGEVSPYDVTTVVVKREGQSSRGDAMVTYDAWRRDMNRRGASRHTI